LKKFLKINRSNLLIGTRKFCRKQNECLVLDKKRSWTGKMKKKNFGNDLNKKQVTFFSTG